MSCDISGCLPGCEHGYFEPREDAVDVLRANQRQIDGDGVMVGVSREALDAVLGETESLRSALSSAREELAEAKDRLVRKGKLLVDAENCACGAKLRAEQAERERESLRLELAAEKSNHAKDNEHFMARLSALTKVEDAEVQAGLEWADMAAKSPELYDDCLGRALRSLAASYRRSESARRELEEAVAKMAETVRTAAIDLHCAPSFDHVEQIKRRLLDALPAVKSLLSRRTEGQK